AASIWAADNRAYATRRAVHGGLGYGDFSRVVLCRTSGGAGRDAALARDGRGAQEDRAVERAGGRAAAEPIHFRDRVSDDHAVSAGKTQWDRHYRLPRRGVRGRRDRQGGDRGGALAEFDRR